MEFVRGGVYLSMSRAFNPERCSVAIEEALERSARIGAVIAVRESWSIARWLGDREIWHARKHTRSCNARGSKPSTETKIGLVAGGVGAFGLSFGLGHAAESNYVEAVERYDERVGAPVVRRRADDAEREDEP